MSLKENIIKIWKAKGQILEGVTNSIFKKEDVEEIAEQRMAICADCPLYTNEDKGCMVPGTTPCCDERQGGCGCSLGFKLRSLSSSCPHPDGPKWEAIVTQEEEDQINQKLGL
jgi:hypothetical protein